MSQMEHDSNKPDAEIWQTFDQHIAKTHLKASSDRDIISLFWDIGIN